MPRPPRSPSFEAPARAAMWATAELLLTSVHHAYGAYVYSTPWRYRVVVVAGAVEAIMLAALFTVRARPRARAGAVARWTFAIVTLTFPVLLIGAVEGFFNHAVKDALYFGGAPAGTMARLFPPPRYEMPDDWFFELTGVLQVVPAVFTARHLLAAVRQRRSPRRPPARTTSGRAPSSASGPA